MTKRQMMEQFYEVIKCRDYIDRLSELHNQSRITYGCYTIKNIYYNYYFKLLLDKNIKNLKKWQVQSYINEVVAAVEEMKRFVEEQENLPFEETQMQVLIKEGKIQWM